MSCWNFEQWLEESLNNAGLPAGFTDEEIEALGEDIVLFDVRHRMREQERPRARSGAERQQGAKAPGLTRTRTISSKALTG